MSLLMTDTTHRVVDPAGIAIARSPQRGLAPFTPRPRTNHYNLDFIALNKLTKEEEQLAHRASTEGLTHAGQHRLDAIAKELDRRWKILG